MPFKVFINDVDTRTESILRKCANHMKLGGAANTLQDRSRIQRDLKKLETWAKGTKIKLNADKCKVLHLEKKNQKHKYKMCDRSMVKTLGGS